MSSRGQRRISNEWLAKYATDECPIRPSTAGVLLGCSWRRIAVQYGLAYEEDNEAAQTGSLLHHGIAEWHKANQKLTPKEVYAIINKGMELFPLADAMDAKLMAQAYMRHPMNIDAVCTHVEQQVTFRLKPAKHDKTQKEIVITGTLDQVRLKNGLHKVFDVKTSRFGPNQVIPTYLLQLGIYAHAASSTFNEEIDMGGFIFPRQLLKELNGFFGSPIGKSAILPALETLANKVAEIRNGLISNTPGDACKYCWAMKNNGVDTCTYLLDRKKPLTVVSSEQPVCSVSNA